MAKLELYNTSPDELAKLFQYMEGNTPYSFRIYCLAKRGFNGGAICPNCGEEHLTLYKLPAWDMLRLEHVKEIHELGNDYYECTEEPAIIRIESNGSVLGHIELGNIERSDINKATIELYGDDNDDNNIRVADIIMKSLNDNGISYLSV